MEQAATLPASRGILLAEDNAGDIYLMKMALRDHGIENDVHIVTDGEMAISAIDRFDAAVDPLLMILDLHLPKRDGLQVLAHLRSRRFGANPPVIVLTSSDSPEARASAERYERVHFFKKPSSLKEFLKLGAVAKSLIEAKDSDGEGLSTMAANGG